MKVVNQKARFDYELLDRVEVGIVLTGAEAKAMRLGQVDLTGSHVKIMTLKSGGPVELWVVNMHIFPYKYADPKTFEPTRTKKLLVSQKELVALETKMKTGRLTLVPTAAYTKGPRVKLEIALARGKRMYEKREAIKRRDMERDVERAIK
jgi:SsrA-binding protein